MGKKPRWVFLWGFFCICNTPPSHFLPLPKSLDYDRAQAETSLAGHRITGGTHAYNPDFFRR